MTCKIATKLTELFLLFLNVTLNFRMGEKLFAYARDPWPSPDIPLSRELKRQVQWTSVPDSGHTSGHFPIRPCLRSFSHETRPAPANKTYASP